MTRDQGLGEDGQLRGDFVLGQDGVEGGLELDTGVRELGEDWKLLVLGQGGVEEEPELRTEFHGLVVQFVFNCHGDLLVLYTVRCICYHQC